jgi:urease accessory protein
MYTPTDSKLITVMQWLSPAFPIGGFAYSHGLEWAINKGYVSNREELQKWVSDLLEYGSLKNDAILIKLVLKGSDPKEINEIAMALCPANERLSETQLQGGAFCKIIREVWSLEIDDLALPIALALAAKNENIDQNLVVPAYLHSFCSNLISVAMRLIPIGQTDGQKTLRELSPLISDSVRAVAKSDKDDLGSACFLSDVSAMQHEYLQPRVFKT